MTRLAYDPEQVIQQLAAELGAARAEAAKLRVALAAATQNVEASEEA